MKAGDIFTRLPGYHDKTAQRVAWLRRMGYGIRSLKGGHYQVLYVPDDISTGFKSDIVYRSLLDYQRHRANDIASGNGLTRNQVSDAVCSLRRRGVSIITGGRGTDMWYQLDRVNKVV